MNRGQLAKLFSTIPVLLFLVLFMGLFVFLASGTGIFRETTRGPSYVPAGASLLSEQVVYAGNTYSVLDLVMRGYFDTSLDKSILTALTPLVQDYFTTQESPRWSWWNGFDRTWHPCVTFAIDEVTVRGGGMLYTFVQKGRFQSCVKYDESTSLSDMRDCDNNYNFVTAPFSRVFVDRANQRFELVAYQGMCRHA
jgi:hypothetical protein